MMTIGIHGTRRRVEPRRKRVNPVRIGIAGRNSAATLLGEADSRIDIGVQNIDEQVDGKD
ncbi:hypothetical protein D3C83_251020 [compost metagenome]